MDDKTLKYFSFMFIFLLAFSFVSSQGCADEGWKGYSAINDNKTIKITCPTCDYINFSAVDSNDEMFLDNVQMDKDGVTFSYLFLGSDLNKTGTYQIDGYSNLDIPLGICFDVTPTGDEDSMTYLFVNFILFLLLIGSIVGVAILNKSIDFEKWNNKIINKYEDKNPVKVLFSGLFYTFMRDSFFAYYLLGWPLLIILEDIMYTFNILSLHTLMLNMIDLYSVGIYIVGLMFIGMAFQFLKGIWDEWENMKWGIDK